MGLKNLFLEICEFEKLCRKFLKKLKKKNGFEQMLSPISNLETTIYRTTDRLQPSGAPTYKKDFFCGIYQWNAEKSSNLLSSQKIYWGTRNQMPKDRINKRYQSKCKISSKPKFLLRVKTRAKKMKVLLNTRKSKSFPDINQLYPERFW